MTLSLSLIGRSLGLSLARLREARRESQRKPGARRPRVVFFGAEPSEPEAPQSRAAVIAELRGEVRASIAQAARPRLAA